MFLKDVRRGCLAVLIVALFLAPAAAQAGTRGGVERARAASARVPQEGVVQVLWRGLVHLFDKDGVSIAPGGAPGSTPAPGTDDEGASIDPSGVSHNG